MAAIANAASAAQPGATLEDVNDLAQRFPEYVTQEIYPKLLEQISSELARRRGSRNGVQSGFPSRIVAVFGIGADLGIFLLKDKDQLLDSLRTVLPAERQ